MLTHDSLNTVAFSFSTKLYWVFYVLMGSCGSTSSCCTVGFGVLGSSPSVPILLLGLTMDVPVAVGRWDRSIPPETRGAFLVTLFP